jgi:LytB protein
VPELSAQLILWNARYFVERVEEIPLGACTVFSAHGVASYVEDEAAALGLPVLDATCSLVSKVHSQAQRYVQPRQSDCADRPPGSSGGGRDDGANSWPGASRAGS